jgi:hypothetical protein
MKRIVLFLALVLFTTCSGNLSAQASLVSSGQYRHEQNRVYKNEVKLIKKLMAVHNTFANKHDLQGLKPLYADSYMNNDGFNKEAYFKTIEETWEECKDLTYKTKILSIDLIGENAYVSVEEDAVGTVFDKLDDASVAGEIHGKSTGIYHLKKLNGSWLIAGETMISDESSLLYGDARFMDIELIAPLQVGAGESYTTTVKVDADENTVIIGSIEHDPVVYPSSIPKGPLRTVPKTNVLERIMKANTDNLNEYTVTSLAISKSKTDKYNNTKIYMAGLACLMKRINVVPKNNFIILKEEKPEDKI